MGPWRNSLRARSFDRTYEGLKRASQKARGPVGAAFDRTYEGLKQDDGNLYGFEPGDAFDRTYEGLKRAPGACPGVSGAYF